MAGTPQNEHLKKIEDDQSILGIGRLDDTLRNEDGRRWFVSQCLIPILRQGHYDDSTGRYVLGHWEPKPIAMSATYSAVSAASYTLTVPAGHRYRLHQIYTQNETRLTIVTLDLTVGGTAMTENVDSGGGGPVLHETVSLLGGAGVANDSAVNSIRGPIVLSAGDTAVVTQGSYVAADATYYGFIYEDWTV